MTRNDVTEAIISAKITKGLNWADVARAVGQSKEWVTAGCLGQMSFSAEQAAVVGRLFDLPDAAVKLLQAVPYKGSLPTTVPTDPLMRTRPQGRPRAHHHERQVPALQDVLTQNCPCQWNRATSVWSA